MTPKKGYTKKYEPVKVDPVIFDDEYREVEDTETTDVEFDELRNELVEEEPTVLASSTDPRGYKEIKPQPKSRALVAYAPFDFAGKHYEAGDAFILPEGYVHDVAADQFSEVSRKNKAAGEEVGMIFAHPPVIEPGRKEPTERRSKLPVKEA